MIFKQWQQVLDGSKTQTRRLVQKRDYATRCTLDPESSIVRVCTNGEQYSHGYRLKWRIANAYAVQPGRGKHSVGRIRITEIRRERLQEISVWDIRAEGIEKHLNWVLLDMRVAFAVLWDSINKKKGTRWKDNPEVWVLTFELVE